MSGGHLHGRSRVESVQCSGLPAPTLPLRNAKTAGHVAGHMLVHAIGQETMLAFVRGRPGCRTLGVVLATPAANPSVHYVLRGERLGWSGLTHGQPRSSGSIACPFPNKRAAACKHIVRACGKCVGRASWPQPLCPSLPPYRAFSF